MSSSTEKNKSIKSYYNELLAKSDPSKASESGIIALGIFIGLGIVAMIFTSYVPTMKDIATLLVALILLSLGIWYLLYSIQLYKIYTQKDNSVMSRLYDRLLTAIGN